jgi:nitronate monooxygenase
MLAGMPPDRFDLDALDHPIVQAPMGGGPSTPALAAAVSAAGGLGFLAAGYRTPDAVRADIAAVREHTPRPFGVGMFVPSAPTDDATAVARYAERLVADADRAGVALGEPRHDDDAWEPKLAALVDERPAVVSFAFGCPPAEVVAGLHDADIAAWVTVTTADEAAEGAAAGADALVVQGVEAGGHRGSFDDAAPGDVGLLALLQLVRARTDLPLVATGGLMTGASVAAVLAAGAAAAQLGTAFLRAREAATSPVHRRALGDPATGTALTRAFTGRTARGLANRFLREHAGQAPSAYPEVHHLTAPLRTAGRERGDAELPHLWAGQAYVLAEDDVDAGELVRSLAADARSALRDAARRFAQADA